MSISFTPGPGSVICLNTPGITVEARRRKGHYTPIEARLGSLAEQYNGYSAALEIIDGYRMEIGLYRNHSSEYAYVFYIMRKP
ncbi:MAG: hypothetical protein ACNA8K_15415 [Cyclonatronaceae bacterium]